MGSDQTHAEKVLGDWKMSNLENVSSEEELLRLRNDSKISEAEYKQLQSAMQGYSTPESRASANSHACPLTKELCAFRKRVLLTAFVICLTGLPIGLVLNLPFVWGLSILGLIVVPVKWHLINKKQSSSG